ncbi:unnamed protein product [Ilex paraguariensis]|uniref:Secreted protein n=1 Tax=Ilex paraguariensis TaxID=185542 RepID=A0ABC8TLD1_9AQUA
MDVLRIFIFSVFLIVFLAALLRYEHPLLIEGRDKCEWVLPITVHAPPQGTTTAHTRNEKPFSLEPLWIRT